MSSSLPAPHLTHSVTNQPPVPSARDLFRSDAVLVEALRREGADWAADKVSAYGVRMGAPEAREWAEQANRNPPVLRTFDRYGNRIDQVDYHPSYHALLEVTVGHEVHNLPWRESREGSHVARSAMLYIASQVEYGHLCPIAMTYGVIPALREQPDLLAEWLPRVRSTDYDRRFLPPDKKHGALIGMAMTEKQGGSDVRTNTTRAVALGTSTGTGAEYALTGHKWFCSAPMSDAFLMLAYTDKGLSCFLVPRFVPDGQVNRFLIQRIKDKLGNRSNASSEIELDGAWARMVGDEGRGVRTIIDMANHTRLDCVTGTAGMMRQALTEALHHVSNRSAFGKNLIDQPMMRNVIADLAVESEAACVLALRLARAFDRENADPKEGPFRRLVTAAGKYWVCKRGPTFAFEALECLGGAGFVEEAPLARVYREMPLNSIWEGSGNVMCLDVLRAMGKDPQAFAVVLDEIKLANGVDRRFDAFVSALESDTGRIEELEGQARMFVERLVLALQGSLLIRNSPKAVADAFCASRLGGSWGHSAGTLPAGVDFAALIDRARPTA